MTTREEQLEELLREIIEDDVWMDYEYVECQSCGAKLLNKAEHKPDCPIRRAQELLTPEAEIQ